MAFAINDKVTITSGGVLNGTTGVIVPLYGTSNELIDVWGRHKIRLDNGGGIVFVGPSSLEGIVKEEDFFPRTIKFEDIRKGDKIRVSRTFSDGSEITHTGIMEIFQKNYNQVKYWRSVDNRATVYEKYVTPVTVTYELLERKGKKLPTKTGSIIRVTKVCGENCDTIAVIDNEGDWMLSDEVSGIRYPVDEDIEEWEEMKVVPA